MIGTTIARRVGAVAIAAALAAACSGSKSNSGFNDPNANGTFGDGDDATFAYSVTLGSPPVTVTQSKQLSRLVFQDPGTVCR